MTSSRTRSPELPFDKFFVERQEQADTHTILMSLTMKSVWRMRSASHKINFERQGSSLGAETCTEMIPFMIVQDTVELNETFRDSRI